MAGPTPTPLTLALRTKISTRELEYPPTPPGRRTEPLLRLAHKRGKGNERLQRGSSNFT